MAPLRDHVLPEVGSLRLDQVKAGHVRAVIDTLRAKGLGQRSLVEVRNILSTVFRAAVEDELVEVNPASGVKVATAKRHPLTPPSADQLAALIGASRGTAWEVPILLAASTGMRRSEVLALTWRHVDLDAARVRVVSSLHRVKDDNGTRLVFLDPKTDRSRRTIALPAFAVDRLRRSHREQAACRLQLGTGWTDLDLVCERGDGQPFDPDSMTSAFKRYAAAAALPPTTRLHDVRHAVATTMLERGIHPAIASAVLGHSSTSFTMNLYQHVMPSMTDQAADAIGAALAVGP
jgi:integrase